MGPSHEIGEAEAEVIGGLRNMDAADAVCFQPLHPQLRHRLRHDIESGDAALLHDGERCIRYTGLCRAHPLPRIFAQFAHDDLEMRRRADLDGREPRLVQMLGDGQDHSCRHQERPERLIAVAHGGVDEPNFRSLGHDGSTRNSSWPYWTSSAFWTQIRRMRSLMPALTGLKSFITSINATVVSSSTRLPSSTKGGAVGSGRR